MSGKLVCLILAVCLAQGLAAPKQPLNVIDDIVSEINQLVEKAKEALQSLVDSIANGGAEIVDKAEKIFSDIINKAKDIVSKAGECGSAELPKLDQLKDEAEAAVKKCVLAELPDGIKLAGELGPVVKDVSALAAELTTKVTGCLALGTVESAICLAKLAVEEEPKVKDAIEEATPVVKDAIAAVQKLEGCAAPEVDKLQQEVDAIVKEVEDCANTQNKL